MLARFWRACSEGIGMTATFWSEGYGEVREARVTVSVELAVRFEPLADLYAALGEPPEASVLAADLASLVAVGEDGVVAIRSDAEVPGRVAELVAAVAAGADQMSSRYASPGQLLEGWLSEEREAPGIGGQAIPALLAVMGREDDAHGGPRTPSGDALGDEKQLNSAAETVRRAQSSGTPAEIRAALEAELARRGIVGRPLWLDRKAEQLHAARDAATRARELWRGLRGLADTGRELVSTFEAGPRPTPAWIQPPANAAHQTRPKAQRFIEVALDPAARPVLELVHAAMAGGALGPAVVDAWLSGAPNSAATSFAPLAVYIGREAVGAIAESDATAVAEVVAQASAYDEVPLLAGCLSVAAGRRPPFIFELLVPA
jgi:hypothetical protein